MLRFWVSPHLPPNIEIWKKKKATTQPALIHSCLHKPWLEHQTFSQSRKALIRKTENTTQVTKKGQVERRTRNTNKRKSLKLLLSINKNLQNNLTPPHSAPSPNSSCCIMLSALGMALSCSTHPPTWLSSFELSNHLRKREQNHTSVSFNIMF